MLTAIFPQREFGRLAEHLEIHLYRNLRYAMGEVSMHFEPEVDTVDVDVLRWHLQAIVPHNAFGNSVVAPDLRDE